MMRALMVVTLLAACSGETSTAPASQSPKPATTGQRQITPRAKLPPAIQPLVPQHGIYAAGGGLTSSAWRVVVDTDKMTIFAGSTQQQNAPSYGPMDKERTNPLTPPNKQRLMQLATDAWNEPPPATPPQPIADYDEVLVVADGDNTLFLEGFGPIRRPAAAKAILELRAAGAL